MRTITVKNIIEDSFSPIGGHKLGNLLVDEMRSSDERISVNFIDVSPFTTLFFNAMFADLEKLGDLSKTVKKMDITKLALNDQSTYERSLKNAINKQAKK